MGIFKWILLLFIIAAAIAIFRPDIYKSMTGINSTQSVAKAEQQSVFDKITDVWAKDNKTQDIVDETIIDAGFPYTISNVSFFKCSSNNVCERIFGSTSWCDIASGHCFRKG